MPPEFRELKSYCDKNGWIVIGNTDYWYYEKVLPNGEILRTKVSHALHKEILPNIWRNILKHQLEITEKEFNDKNDSYWTVGRLK